MSAPQPRVPAPFDELYGLEVTRAGADEMRGRVPFDEKLTQPMGLVHGGVYAAVAESLASVGTYLGVHEDGNVAMGMNNFTTFLRPVTEGDIEVVARPLRRGRTQWIWDVTVSDAQQRDVAVSRVTVAVRPARGGGPA